MILFLISCRQQHSTMCGYVGSETHDDIALSHRYLYPLSTSLLPLLYLLPAVTNVHVAFRSHPHRDRSDPVHAVEAIPRARPGG
jgi:hypothetical protein